MLVTLIVMTIICGFYLDSMLVKEGLLVWPMLICYEKAISAMHCNYCVSLLLISVPLFNFPFLALQKGPQCLVVKQCLFCCSSSEGLGFIIGGGSVYVLGGGNAIWKICKRNCLSMNVGSHLPKERGGEVEALEFSISGVINRACVWQGAVHEPRAGHWEPSEPGDREGSSYFSRKVLFAFGRLERVRLQSWGCWTSFPASSMFSSMPKMCASAALLGSWCRAASLTDQAVIFPRNNLWASSKRCFPFAVSWLPVGSCSSVVESSWAPLDPPAPCIEALPSEGGFRWGLNSCPKASFAHRDQTLGAV